MILSDLRSAIETLQNYFPKKFSCTVQGIKFTCHKLYEADVNVEICWILTHVGLKGSEDANKIAKDAVAQLM